MVVFFAFYSGSLGTGGKTGGPSGTTSGGDRAQRDHRRRRRGGKRWPGYSRDHHSRAVRQACGGQVEDSDMQDRGDPRRV
jgi:hypothetical protein